MNPVQTIMAALFALALVLSGVISHAGHGAAQMDVAAASHHAHGADHGHHHGNPAAQNAEMPHCCSMGACGYVASPVPERRIETVEAVCFQTATLTLRSVFPPLDSPPPRRET